MPTASLRWNNFDIMPPPCNLVVCQAKELTWPRMESEPFSKLRRPVVNQLRSFSWTSSRPTTDWFANWRPAQQVPILSSCSSWRLWTCPRMWCTGSARRSMSLQLWAKLDVHPGFARLLLNFIATPGTTCAVTPHWIRRPALQHWKTLAFALTLNGMAISLFELVLGTLLVPRPSASHGPMTLQSWSDMASPANFWRRCR